jgi:hypothetical protein
MASTAARRVAVIVAGQCRSLARRMGRSWAESTIRTAGLPRKRNHNLKGWRECLLSWLRWAGQVQSRAPAYSDRMRLPLDMKPVVEGACLAGSRNLKASHPAGS